jgi:hypothetical protein
LKDCGIFIFRVKQANKKQSCMGKRAGDGGRGRTELGGEILLLDCATLKMKTLQCFEVPATIDPVTHHKTPEALNLL